MADVGVLNLQIQADASQASTSLNALADALTRVKNAVGNGLSFGKLPTQLGKIREALGGNWGGSEQFKTAMTNLKDGANVIARANVGEKLANDAKGITAWVNAYQKVINTLNSVKKQDTASSKVESTVSSATSGMSQNASMFSSSMFGGRFAQHFYALNDPDSGYGKVVSDIKTQTESVSNAVTTSGAKIKDAVSNSTEAMKSGVSADAASGFKEIENTLKQMDAGTVQNIISLASALKELKGVSGIGKQLNDAAVGLNAVLKFDGSNKGTSGTIERIGTALKHFGEKTTDFKVPSFNNLIKLAEALQKGFFASVEIENIAKALEHLKQASDGFVMPNLSGLTKLSSALAGTGVADAKAVAGMQKVGSTVDETVGKMEQLGSVTDTNGVAGQITDLFARLNSPIDYSKLGEFAGQMAGIGQSANVTKQELDVFATDASQKIDSLIQHLNAPVSYKGLKEFVDFSQGGGRSFKSSEQDWEALFKIGEGASSASKQLVAMQQAVDNVTGSYMRLEVAGQQAMYVPRSPEDVKADRDNALSRMKDNQARREAVWSSETSDNMRNAQEQIYAVKGAADQATQSVQNLHNVVNTQTGVNANQMVPNTGAIDGASQSIANYADTIRNVDTVVNSMSSDQARMISEATSLESQINSLADTELMMRDNLVQDIQAGRLDANQIAERAAQIRLLQTEQANLYARLVEMEHAQRISTRAMNALKGAFQNLREGMSKLPFVGLIKQMMRMARMRALRYMIRELAKGFREGVENVYHYSEAIGGSFHESMDSAATALNQMKNSIGAAVAPALQALIPLFNTIVGWITTAANYLNQFFSLLSGKGSWTRALPVATKAFDEQKKSAKGASNAVKDMLADFDELNIIQQNGNGNGTTTTKPETDYTEMFEEVSEFDSKIKDMVGWIEDHMETVKGIAIAIGAAILGWKISKAFDGALGSLGTIIAGGAMLAIGWQLVYEGAYAAGENGGFSTEALMSTIGGSISSALGGGLIGFKLGGTTGAVIGAITGLVVSAAVGIVAYYDGEEAAKARAKWGKLHLTDEQISELVDTQVTANVHARLHVIDAKINNIHTARNNANHALEEFGSELSSIKLRMGLDGTKPEIDNLLEKAGEAINAIQASLQAENAGLQISFTKFSYKNSNGDDITGELLNEFNQGTMALDKFFTDMGNEISYYISKGYREGLTEQEQENAMALMSTFDNMAELAERNYRKRVLQRQVQEEIGGTYDLETAQKVLDKQLETLETYKTTLQSDIENDIDAAEHQRAWLDTVRAYYEEKGNEDAVAEYDKYIADNQELLDKLYEQLGQMKNGTYDWMADEDYAEMYNVMRDAWKEMLRQSYGEKYFSEILSALEEDEKMDMEEAFAVGMKQALISLGWAKDNTVTDPITAIMSAFNLRADNDLLTDADKERIGQYLIDRNSGDKSKAVEDLDIIGLANQADIEKYIPDAYGTRTGDHAEEIKKEIFNALLYSNGDEIIQELDHIKSRYGDAFDDVYTESFDRLKEILNEMNQSTYGRTESEFRELFSEVPELVDAYLEYLENYYGITLGASRHNPTQFVGSAGAGLPLGPAPIRQRNSMFDTDYETNDSDARTATATEGTQQELVTQNDKLDRVERLLTAVLSRLNNGLNVNMAPTSTGGRVVNGMLDALTRVTGNN